MTDAENRAYHRGYKAGSRGAWPDHLPPLPPDILIRAVYQALQSLTGAVESITWTLPDDEELVQKLEPHTEEARAQMKALAEWLRDRNPQTVQ